MADRCCVLDLARVLCSLAELGADGCRSFTVGEGDWPLRGFVVGHGEDVRAYVNQCPHAGHPLNVKPHGFLTPDGALIVCSSHGALFEKRTGYCVAGPCSGQSLRRVPIRIEAGYVLLEEVEPVE